MSTAAARLIAIALFACAAGIEARVYASGGTALNLIAAISAAVAAVAFSIVHLRRAPREETNVRPRRR